MKNLLVRKSGNSRFVRDIDQNLYRSGGESTVFAGREMFLAPASMQLDWWQRHGGLLLAPDKLFVRLLTLHRLAFEAELEGKFGRADFFWQEVLAQLRRAWTRKAVWEAAHTAVGGGSPHGPESLRDRILAELFIDTHVAFVNGRLLRAASPAADDRAFVHLNYVRKLLEFQTLPPDEAAGLISPAVEAQISALETAGRWTNAIACATQHLAMNSGDTKMQDRLAMLHFRRAIDQLSDNANGNDLAEASRLGEAIESLDRAQKEDPDRTLIYDLLGQLCHLQSVRLANGGELSKALVAARKAQLYAPSLAAADETMSQLLEAMTQLKTQIQEVEKKLRASANTGLTEEGRRLQAEATRGFSALENYMKSSEPTRVATARRLAHARAIWRDVGFAPEIKPADEQALGLMDAVGQIYGSEATGSKGLAAEFRKIAKSEEAIAAIPPKLVADFVLKRRRENAGETSGTDADPSTAVAGQGQTAGAFVISAPEPVTKSDGEPFWYWLFGTQDRGLRAVGGCAVVAVVAMLGVTALDIRGSHIRSSAYDGVVAAAAAGGEAAATKEAQRFHGAWSLRASDPREARIEELKREAIEAPNLKVRNTAVEQLKSALESGDQEAVLNAAERFLGAPPLQAVDERRDAVLDIYARAFSIWFAETADPLALPGKNHIDAYGKLVAGTQASGG
ncbi:hypothetical protein NKH84_28385 [Mesorhizobium sp. M0902]|uniref:hypothetical protein n=1 Tax=Mesorhizobium sp. M0902 TaxID=2957021 RepID=UPI00333A47A4